MTHMTIAIQKLIIVLLNNTLSISKLTKKTYNGQCHKYKEYEI